MKNNTENEVINIRLRIDRVISEQTDFCRPEFITDEILHILEPYICHLDIKPRA